MIRVREGRPSSRAQSFRTGHPTVWKTAALFWVVTVGLFARPATAAELAILRNGFSIRHEHRLVMGANTHLYLAADDSSFTDVPTEEITGYEKDLSLPLPPDT